MAGWEGSCRQPRGGYETPTVVATAAEVAMLAGVGTATPGVLALEMAMEEAEPAMGTVTP